jgi:hypothetical protein
MVTLIRGVAVWRNLVAGGHLRQLPFGVAHCRTGIPLAINSKEAFDDGTKERIVMPSNDGWVNCVFTRAQLDDKRIYFPLPPQNEMYFGHLHVEENGTGQIRITIDYGKPGSPGGQWTADQAFADKIMAMDYLVPSPD